MRYFLEECGEVESIGSPQLDGRTFEQYAEDLHKPESAIFLAIYRNSLKTMETVSDALQGGELDQSARRSRGFSPV